MASQFYCFECYKTKWKSSGNGHSLILSFGVEYSADDRQYTRSPFKAPKWKSDEYNLEREDYTALLLLRVHPWMLKYNFKMESTSKNVPKIVTRLRCLDWNETFRRSYFSEDTVKDVCCCSFNTVVSWSFSVCWERKGLPDRDVLPSDQNWKWIISSSDKGEKSWSRRFSVFVLKSVLHRSVCLTLGPCASACWAS